MITLNDGKQSLRLEGFEFRPLRSHSRPRSGSISHKTVHIPGTSGDWYFGSEIGSKEYSLQAYTFQEDFKKFNQLIDDLTGFLLDPYGKPKLLKITFDDTEPVKFVYARLKDAILPNVDSILEKVPIKFVAHEPNEYATSSAYDLEKPLKYDEANPYGSKAYPNTTSLNWIYSRHYSGLENYSSLNTDIKITVKGTVKGGSVTHLETGTKLEFPDISNGTIVIDSGTFNVSVNGVDTIFDGDFPVLVPSDNGFLFEAETVNAMVNFEWYHKFN